MTRRRMFLAAASAAVVAAAFTSVPAWAATPPPTGYTATFSGALKGAAQGGTSDGCVITSRPADPNQGPVTPSPLLLPRLVTAKWDNFTVKKKPASMTLLVGAPLSGTPGQANPVPWQQGAPTGTAELTVTTKNGNFVTTPDVKPGKADTNGVFTVDSTLKQGKQKLHVKATFDCTKAGTSGDVPTG